MQFFVLHIITGVEHYYYKRVGTTILRKWYNSPVNVGIELGPA